MPPSPHCLQTVVHFMPDSRSAEEIYALVQAGPLLEAVCTALVALPQAGLACKHARN